MLNAEWSFECSLFDDLDGSYKILKKCVCRVSAEFDSSLHAVSHSLFHVLTQFRPTHSSGQSQTNERTNERTLLLHRNSSEVMSNVFDRIEPRTEI